MTHDQVEWTLNWIRERYGTKACKGIRRLAWWDRSLWWRTCKPGGFDGYRTIGGRKLPCATLDTALRRPDMRDEIRRLSAG